MAIKNLFIFIFLASRSFQGQWLIQRLTFCTKVVDSKFEVNPSIICNVMKNWKFPDVKFSCIFLHK